MNMILIMTFVNFILIAIFITLVIIDKKREMKRNELIDEQLDSLIKKLDDAIEVTKQISFEEAYRIYYNPDKRAADYYRNV